mmetsp:Transcript_105914/g.299417  ORF Transcript_105914/g.299417 Transcript_105914/m.299417 type:complete len:211 (-) Transcript_105914:30-662(-)
MRADRPPAHAKVRDGHADVGNEALRDPVLEGTPVRAVEQEHLALRMPGACGVDHEARVHARKGFRQPEAADLALSLEVVEQLHLLWTAKGNNCAGKEVEVHREPNPEARPEACCQLSEHAVRRQEALRPVADVSVPEDAARLEAPQEGHALGVRDLGAEGAEGVHVAAELRLPRRVRRGVHRDRGCLDIKRCCSHAGNRRVPWAPFWYRC